MQFFFFLFFHFDIEAFDYDTNLMLVTDAKSKFAGSVSENVCALEPERIQLDINRLKPSWPLVLLVSFWVHPLLRALRLLM